MKFILILWFPERINNDFQKGWELETNKVESCSSLRSKELGFCSPGRGELERQQLTSHPAPQRGDKPGEGDKGHNRLEESVVERQTLVRPSKPGRAQRQCQAAPLLPGISLLNPPGAHSLPRTYCCSA